jgi:hypothetical protein
VEAIMKFTIDRFEGDFAVCENENLKMVNIKKDLLPIEAKEGDILIKQKDDSYIVDSIATGQRKERISKLLNGLFEE